MRIAHLADLHLGFRQYAKQAADGMNRREVDVAESFTRAVDAITAARPDMVVVAGDVFHASHPPNAALVHALQQFARLAAVAPVVVVAGNHDSPRSSDTGHILPALAAVGVQVVLRDPKRVRIGDVAVWCVPDTGVPRCVAWEPDSSMRYNVVVAHGEVAGAVGGEPGGEHDWPASTWDAGWDYVALGHYHQQQQVAARAWYAGAIEYTSSNPWAEIDGAPKGWLLADLATGAVTPHPTPGVRRFADLPRLSAAGAEPDAVLASVREQIASVPGGAGGAVVRQVVINCEPSTRRAFSPAALRGLRRGLLHLHLDVRRAETKGVTQARTSFTRRPLAEMLADSLIRRSEVSGIDPTRLLDVGGRYLETAEAAGADLVRE